MTQRHPLRIGIDGSALAGFPMAGVGRYVFELCKALDRVMPSAQFFVYAPVPLKSPLLSSRWNLKFPNPPRGLRSLHWLTLATYCLSRADRLDVFWHAAGIMPLAVPAKAVKSVLTVHDLSHKLVPKTMDRRGLWMHRVLVSSSIGRARALTAVSAGTAEKIRYFYNRAVDAVVPPGVSAQFRPAAPSRVDSCLRKFRLKPPYILAVGTREPRKNLDLLVQTFLKMKSDGLLAKHALVIAGARGWKDWNLERLLVRSKEAGIRTLGYVPDDDLPPLYTGCDLFVFPSIYEGFGIPVAEARACGARVVATDIPEIREAGDEATIYVAPTQEGLRTGILSALAQPQTAPHFSIRDWECGARIFASLLDGSSSLPHQ